MKSLLILAALVAVATARIVPGSSSPASQTLVIGSNGSIGSSLLDPFVSIIINVNKALGNLVSIEGLPTEVAQPTPASPALPEFVTVVEGPQEAVHVVESAPETVNVVESAPESLPVVPVEVVQQPEAGLEPTPEAVIVVEQPDSPLEPVIVVEQPSSPLEPVIVVEQPSAPLEPVIVVEQPSSPLEPEIVVEQPSSPLEPVIVVEQPASPLEPVVVVEQPEFPLDPVSVVEQPEITPETPGTVIISQEEESGITNNYFINVLFKIITGSSDSTSISSNTLPSIVNGQVAAPRE